MPRIDRLRWGAGLSLLAASLASCGKDDGSRGDGADGAATGIPLDDGGDVYLNGKLAHTREHLSPLAWQESFTVDVTALIRPGEDNILAIHGQDHYGMGGLWKPVVLYTQP